MSRLRIATIALCAGAAFLSVTTNAQVYTTVDLTNDTGNTMISRATAQLLDFFGNPNPGALAGWHRIAPTSSGSVCSENNWFDEHAPWDGTLQCGGEGATCYRGRVYASSVNTVFAESETGTHQICFGGTGCTVDCSFEQEPLPGCPIVLNPGRGSWQLSDADVLFDLDADGNWDLMGWTGRGGALAFLVIDNNANGVIDDGSELFGIGTLLPNGQRAANGFESLRQHDANADGLIDASDAIWSSLLLWTDANHDAVSQSNELAPISDSFTALELTFREVGKRDVYGNTLRYQAHALNGNARYPYYDVFFFRP